MTFEEFLKLIEKNSKIGESTAFIKPNVTIDDYRRSRPGNFETIEAVMVYYSPQSKKFRVTDEDSGEQKDLSKKELEEEFYEHQWGAMIHK